MGYTRHHAIVVTSWNDELIKKASLEARKIFGTEVSRLLKGDVNNFMSFMIPPDGSKEGWGESDEGDSRRAKFITWLNDQAYDDGSNALSFCEFFYGDDEGESSIENHN